MRKTILLLFLFASSLGFAQDAEKHYYIYNVITFTPSYEVKIDDGKNVDKLRDKNGKKMHFMSMAGALTYFSSKGWEICSNYSTTSEGYMINGFGASDSSISWLIRKPVTKEEAEKAASEAVEQ